jgi:SAM-dependent methyltransferase
MKQSWAAPERNKGPILEVLQRVFPQHGRALELSSGSGQHAVHFARAFPGLEWTPSDLDPENLASIRAWVGEERLPNLGEPLCIDVLQAKWGVAASSVDAVFNANMIHIAPWACGLGLLRGVGQVLKSGGVLVLYGPFRIGGVHTSPSNESFDAGLRARDPAWGVRDLEAVVDQARENALVFQERVEMPANNQSLVFRRL